MSRSCFIHFQKLISNLICAGCSFALIPEYGIGRKLIKAGIKACSRLAYDSIIVLEHPEYYPKFGFRQANTWRITDRFDAPIEAFMALELKEGVLEGANGILEYPDEFLEVLKTKSDLKK